MRAGYSVVRMSRSTGMRGHPVSGVWDRGVMEAHSEPGVAGTTTLHALLPAAVLQLGTWAAAAIGCKGHMHLAGLGLHQG